MAERRGGDGEREGEKDVSFQCEFCPEVEFFGREPDHLDVRKTTGIPPRI